MVTNVYAKFNYDPLHIDKALGIFENLVISTTTRRRTTFVAIRDPFMGSHMRLKIPVYVVVFVTDEARPDAVGCSVAASNKTSAG